MSRARPAASSRSEAPPSLHWQIAWRHLRAGDRPPSWAWPAVGLAVYLLVVGGGFVLYALYGFSPVEAGLPERVALDSSLVGLGFDPTADLPPPAQAYFGVLGAITLLLGAGLLLGAVLSLVFTLLATVITVSVMLGCMALVVVLSLMTGLELELRDKILGQRAHIRVAAADGRPFADYRDLAEAIADKPGILGASPYLQGEVMVRSGFQRQGGILLGIDPELHRSVSNLPDILREGDYEFLAHPEKIPESEFGFEITPVEPPPAQVDADEPKEGEGATALPHVTGAEGHVPEDKPQLVDDDPDEGWEDPEVEIPALRKKGALPPAKPEPAEPEPAKPELVKPGAVPTSPAAAIPTIPRSPFGIVPAGEEDEGWEDPEVEIGKLRASGKLPPAQAAAEVQPEPAPEVEAEVEEPPARAAVVDGLLIGAEKAKELAARTGDQVQLITPIGRMTPAGRIPGVMAVRVAGVFDADHYDYDRWLVYASLPVAQAFLRAGDRVTGLEVKVDDLEQLDVRRQAVQDAVDAAGRDDLIVQDWQELNRSLFSAMALEKIAVFVALLCVILVASFGILGSNLMSVIEKSKEIAILKTMGCTDTLIQRIFISEGLCLGILGGLLGIATGIGLCGLLDRFGLPLSGSLQSFEQLPVAIDAFEVVLVGVSSLVIVWLSSLYPARIASRMRPVDALRQAER
ncbi:lipoprotein-releasing system permease protein [Nannocystis exedens]|uniref:Lipoprotein-releasing system permease protein n=1 Tax=Nannocystis exedens TaxID=54 RepID=A0A1I1W5N2_9BACT|nr:FtsX-like permease family protein [Nannocystis exedens]SFD90462.1 lipoprotein-releasing system permease protein [Nannocystis exedens]